jgi:hypothetical protein
MSDMHPLVEKIRTYSHDDTNAGIIFCRRRYKRSQKGYLYQLPEKIVQLQDHGEMLNQWQLRLYCFKELEKISAFFDEPKGLAKAKMIISTVRY